MADRTHAPHMHSVCNSSWLPGTRHPRYAPGRPTPGAALLLLLRLRARCTQARMCVWWCCAAWAALHCPFAGLVLQGADHGLGAGPGAQQHRARALHARRTAHHNVPASVRCWCRASGKGTTALFTRVCSGSMLRSPPFKCTAAHAEACANMQCVRHGKRASARMAAHASNTSSQPACAASSPGHSAIRIMPSCPYRQF